MKTAKYWQDTLNGDTSVEAIKEIQNDALTHALKIVGDHGAVYSPHGPVRGFSNKVIDAIASDILTPKL